MLGKNTANFLRKQLNDLPSKLLVELCIDTSVYTALYEAESGKLLEQREFSDRKAYKAKRQERKGAVKRIEIKDPYRKNCEKRYELREWAKAPITVGDVAGLLRRFAFLCGESGRYPKAQAPLLLLGTFLSGYTSEPFFVIDQETNPDSKARAVILNVPWAEGITAVLQKAAKNLSVSLFSHLKEKPQFDWAPQAVIPTETGSLEECVRPFWQPPSDGGELLDTSPSPKTVLEEIRLPLRRVNDAVLMQQWTGLKMQKAERFLRENPFCATVVLRSPRAKLMIDGTLPLNPRELIWADEKFSGWADLQYLVRGFAAAIFDRHETGFWEILRDQWSRAETLIARYQAQKGVQHLTAAQRRTWRMLLASLLAFLAYLHLGAGKLTRAEYAALHDEWLWRLLPGCIAGDTVEKPPLIQRPFITEQDYLDVFLSLIDHIQKSDGGIHILRVPKDDRLFELQDPDNPDIEVYGYYADIYLRSAGQYFPCLVFRKQTLLNLMRSFMPEVVSVPLDAGRVLRYALKSNWAQKNILRQSDGYFKLHMPAHLQDKGTTYAVAIRAEALQPAAMEPAKNNAETLRPSSIMPAADDATGTCALEELVRRPSHCYDEYESGIDEFTMD